MLELLRDGLWQSVGVFATLIAIIVSVIIYRRQAQKKLLTWVRKSAYPLLTRTEELQGRLQVQVDGVAVNNIDIMFIEFSNSGNVPIERGDFDNPVKVDFDPPARIISVDVESEEPEGIGASLLSLENSVTLNPILLNPGDKITIKFILSNAKKFGIYGRIVGVKEIREGTPSNIYPWIGLFGLLLVAIGFAITVHYSPKPIVLPPRPLEFWIGLAITSIGYFIAAFAFLRGNILRKISRMLARLFT